MAFPFYCLQQDCHATKPIFCNVLPVFCTIQIEKKKQSTSPLTSLCPVFLVGVSFLAAEPQGMTFFPLPGCALLRSCSFFPLFPNFFVTLGHFLALPIRKPKEKPQGDASWLLLSLWSSSQSCFWWSTPSRLGLRQPRSFVWTKDFCRFMPLLSFYIYGGHNSGSRKRSRRTDCKDLLAVENL